MAQRGQHDPPVRFGLLPGERAQGSAGADFQQDLARLLQDRVYALGEAHGLAKVVRPVGRVGRLLRRDPGSGNVRDKGNRGGVQRDISHHLYERFDDRVHHGGMEGM